MSNGLPFDSDAAKKSIDRVLALFAAKCVGETNVYERYLFLDRRQGASEDFEEYLTDLKATVRRCDYGSNEDALLRDRIVHGIVRESVRKRLLSKKDLTLEKCVALCRGEDHKPSADDAPCFESEADSGRRASCRALIVSRRRDAQHTGCECSQERPFGEKE